MSLRVFVGQFDDVQVQWPPPALNGSSIAQHLATAATHNGGSPVIDVDVDAIPGSLGPGPDQLGVFELHDALRQLTSNTIGQPVSSLGVVLARQFTHRPAAFGLMFDVGFGEAGDASFNSLPREGCAIFVGAIRARRQSPPGAFDTQLAFTTIHELGHVFNLWHLQSPLNFLSTSPAEAPHPPEAFHFEDVHTQFLTDHAGTAFVLPGGARFGTRGPGMLSGDNPLERRRSESPLRLSIAMKQTEFWHFEPVELDVTVSVGRNTTRAMMPDVIDPGYEAFTVWIDAPDGTRRRYRPVAWYCETLGRRAITPRTPFRRDIPVFGQSGGYTFTAAGPHRLFCTLRLGQHVITSNPLEIVVKPAARQKAKYERLSHALRDRRNAQLLFYKAARRPGTLMKALIEAAKDAEPTTAANIRYSLARAMLWATPSQPATRRKYHQHAGELLQRARDSGRLGDVREEKASVCLDSMEQ